MNAFYVAFPLPFFSLAKASSRLRPALRLAKREKGERLTPDPSPFPSFLLPIPSASRRRWPKGRGEKEGKKEKVRKKMMDYFLEATLVSFLLSPSLSSCTLPLPFL